MTDHTVLSQMELEGHLHAAVEGAVAHFVGRPFEAAPEGAPTQLFCWRYGWIHAEILLEAMGQMSARRWLSGEPWHGGDEQ